MHRDDASPWVPALRAHNRHCFLDERDRARLLRFGALRMGPSIERSFALSLRILAAERNQMHRRRGLHIGAYSRSIHYVDGEPVAHSLIVARRVANRSIPESLVDVDERECR
jgi:hypothetical protein